MRKGAPPTIDGTLGNLDKADAGDVKNLNFKVFAAFHREFAVNAAMQGKTQTEILFQAFELWKQKNRADTP